MQRGACSRELGWRLCFTLLLAACVNPNTYTTPRSLPPGAATFTVAPEVSGFGGSLNGAWDFGRTLPIPPTLGFRYGLSESVDFGARVASLTAAGDLKWNFLRSQLFDLAVVPGFQLYVVPNVGASDVSENVSQDMPVALLHAPVLLAVNLTPNFSIVPSLGVSYSLAEQPPSAASDIELSQVLYGLFGRAGLGLDLRVTPSFALHPELTLLRGFGDSEGFLVFTGGLGLVFGRLAQY
ncbi:MAG: hypothetical protein ABI895_27780 [Deltaproteobacteria bacterium]